MTDIQQNPEIAIAEKHIQIEELKINIKRADLEVLRMLDQIERCKYNKKSTEQTIVSLTKEIDEMTKAIKS